FLAFGRVGCTMVGCCHGRPGRIGLCYREEHADEGFPRYLVGVRLVPVQALESLGVAAIVGVGVALVVAGSTSGTALAWYAAAYAVLRFFLEFLRGDAGRRYSWGFSEAQWTSLGVAIA